MAEPLVIQLLGPPRFSQATVPVSCASRKAVALFVYLLLDARTHARRELAALLWGRADEAAARASLRVALHRLPPALAGCLRVDRESIEVALPPVVDVTRFEALARADDLSSLESATELYQGELLQDFEADATPEYDDWLHAQRIRLEQVAQQAFDDVIARRADRARRDEARAAPEREAALAACRRWAALMPGAEAAHRWLMRLYLDTGRRDAALAQYDLCQRLLAVTGARAPTAQTRELYEVALGRAHGEAPAARGEAPVAWGAAPAREAAAGSVVPTTSFVGRIEELAALDRLLGDPNCRLLTLHGPAGAGKTRLAHALAGQVTGRFAQGATWVAPEAVGSADALSLAIAAAAGCKLPPGGDCVDLVADALAAQERLLVLDGLELSAARETEAADASPDRVIERILQRAPAVRVLVTSREAIGLQEEWNYDVHGLAHQPQASQGAAPAVELFAQRARHAYLGFSLPAEMPHVLRICQRVEGLPLGIELAAAWVRAIPCGEIAAAIERTATPAGSRHRNRAEREHGLDAVLAHSWNLLASEQQHTLAALAVFAGGFTREAAERVAGATLRSLSVLVDKALVQQQSQGRYGLHEAVRLFALRGLAGMKQRHAATIRRHAEYFIEVALRIAGETEASGEAAAEATFATELSNLLAAFDRAVQAPWRELVVRGAAPLASILFTHGRVRAARDVARRALAAVGDDADGEAVAPIHLQYDRAAKTLGQPSWDAPAPSRMLSRHS